MFEVAALEIVTFADDGDAAAQSTAISTHHDVDDRMAPAPKGYPRVI
jgi:hypothetical protein